MAGGIGFLDLIFGYGSRKITSLLDSNAPTFIEKVAENGVKFVNNRSKNTGLLGSIENVQQLTATAKGLQTEARAVNAALDESIPNLRTIDSTLELAKPTLGAAKLQEPTASLWRPGVRGRAATEEEWTSNLDRLVSERNSYAASEIDPYIDRAGKNTWNTLKFAGSIGKNYMLGGTASQIASKVGLAAGVPVGLRYLSGGTLTTNNSGERDIAGIPFI